MPSVLVTGAHGFVGGAVVEAFSEAGWATHALSRKDTGGAAPYPHHWSGVMLHHWTSGTDALGSLFASVRPDVVVHLASSVVVEHTMEHVGPLAQANLQFGMQVVDAAIRSGTRRLINTGTVWQHGVDIDDPYPVNLYAATKRAFEEILRWYHGVQGLSCINLLLADTYGPGDTRGKLLPLLLSARHTGADIALSPGGQLVDITHVQDVARGFVIACAMALAAPSPVWSHYRLSGTRLSVRSLVEKLEHAIGKPLPVTWGGRPYRVREVMEPVSHGLDILPGWAPRISLASGLQMLVDSQDPC